MATAKQIAWRKKFAEMARSGKLSKAPARKSARKVAKKAARKSNPVRASNPLPVLYKVQSRSGDGRAWSTIIRTPSQSEAEKTARELHKAYPNRAYRVIDTER